MLRPSPKHGTLRLPNDDNDDDDDYKLVLLELAEICPFHGFTRVGIQCDIKLICLLDNINYLIWKQHIENVTKCGNKALGFLRRK